MYPKNNGLAGDVGGSSWVSQNQLWVKIASASTGVAVYALMMADITSKILEALSWQGVFIMAWVGVEVAHITSSLGKAETQESVQLQEVEPWRWSGLAAWLAGALAGVVCVNVASLAGFSAPVSFCVAFVAVRCVSVTGVVVE